MGTISQLRNDFNHRNVTTDVMNSFNYADDFTRFLTEAHIVYLAMEVCEMADIKDRPAGSIPRGTPQRRKVYLQDLCKKMVDRIWLGPSHQTINAVLEAEGVKAGNRWCFCGEDGNYIIIYANWHYNLHIFALSFNNEIL